MRTTLLGWMIGLAVLAAPAAATPQLLAPAAPPGAAVCMPDLMSCPPPCPNPPAIIRVHAEVCLDLTCTTQLPPECRLDCYVAVDGNALLSCR